MHTNTDSKKKVLHRLKIAKGHLEKVIRMIEDGDYCIDIIHQSQAVQKAISETDNIILDTHLKTCVADQIKKGNSDKAISEIVEVFKKGR